MLKSRSIRHGIPASCRTRLNFSLASTWIKAEDMRLPLGSRFVVVLVVGAASF